MSYWPFSITYDWNVLLWMWILTLQITEDTLCEQRIIVWYAKSSTTAQLEFNCFTSNDCLMFLEVSMFKCAKPELRSLRRQSRTRWWRRRRPRCSTAETRPSSGRASRRGQACRHPSCRSWQPSRSCLEIIVKVVKRAKILLMWMCIIACFSLCHFMGSLLLKKTSLNLTVLLT